MRDNKRTPLNGRKPSQKKTICKVIRHHKKDVEDLLRRQEIQLKLLRRKLKRIIKEKHNNNVDVIQVRLKRLKSLFEKIL